MTTSVALCTYNGAQHIRKQVESIISQTVPVDEIVICDDRSSDNTLHIIEQIQQQTHTNILVYRNETNLGVCANFQKAVNLCTGDIIFLSDQDDVWVPEKVKTIIDWFYLNPSKNVVFSDAILIDSDGHTIGNSLFNRVGFSEEYRKYFDAGCELPVFYCNHATGATMAIRGKIQFAEYCSPSILHDEVISLLAIQDKALGYITQPLTQYRIHGEQEKSIPPDEQSAQERFNEVHILDPNINASRINRWVFPFNDRTRSYIDFLKKRSHFSSSIFCFVYTLLYKNTYKQQYGSMYRRFIQYDRKLLYTRVKKVLNRRYPGIYSTKTII